MLNWIIIGVILSVGIFIIVRAIRKFTKDEDFSFNELGKLIVMVMVIIIAISVVNMSFSSVDVGHAKLVIDPWSNTISEPHVGAKWFFRPPWTYTVDIYYATSSTEMWTDKEAGTQGEYPAVHVLSKDGMDIEVDILIRYQLDPNALADLYRSFPRMDYETKAIASVLREDVRDVISQYTAIEIIETRESISVAMTNLIYDSLMFEPSLKQALLASSIQIDLRDIDPPAGFKLAIEAKLTAEQQKIQAEFEREKALIEADAIAQSKVIQANAEGESKIIIANSTAEAIRTIQEQVGEEGWEVYYSLQMLKEIAPNIKFLILNTGEGQGDLPIYFQVPE